MGDQKIELNKNTFYLCTMCRGMFLVRKKGDNPDDKDFGRCFGNAPHVFFPGNSYRLARALEVLDQRKLTVEARIRSLISSERPLTRPSDIGLSPLSVTLDELLAAGFTTEQVTVICSRHAVQEHFARFEHQDPAGSKTPAAALTGRP